MNLDIENLYNNKIVAGVDEAGRGPLAGPVVAAAVIIDQNNIIDGIKDSKKLSKNKREELYNKIISNYIYSVGLVSVEEIDRINILQATIKACELSITNLNVKADIAIIDGNMKFHNPNYHSVVKGDNKSLSIAAASIIAKVTRDRIMENLSNDFPNYKWYKNSGYGTKEHLEAINNYGLTIHHRKSFNTKRQS